MTPFDNPPTHRYYSTIALSPEAWAWLESEAVRRETSIEEVLTALVEQSRAVAVAAAEIHPADEETIKRWIKELP